MKVSVIGAGLAGCEAAWILANNGVLVDLYEMKPQKYTPAHKYQGFGELVCSNSLKSKRIGSAGGLLKEEMRLLNSLVIQCAGQTSVSAGGALAVDREKFSDLMTEKILSNKNINVISTEVTKIPDGKVIIATGPLTSDALAENILSFLGSEYLSFFDAAAPIVMKKSIDFESAFYASRYGKGDNDYINCPMNLVEYESFHYALTTATTAELSEFDKREFKVYEGCMPIEVMAKRGLDTMRFGPLKPVGLDDPKTGKRPYAVVQLRAENSEGSLYNLVGFQTNLKWAEQKRVFSLIPALKNAEFVRYGVMHRNTFINSPKLLNNDFSLKSNPEVFFAGQITGVEGYSESASSGIIAGLNMLRLIQNKSKLVPPKDTMIGALSYYISDETVRHFQPMGCNMGLLPPLGYKVKDKMQRYDLVAEKSLISFNNWLGEWKNEDNS